MNCKEIIREYLTTNGYVGLHRYQCACTFDDLIRCQDGEAFGCAPTTPRYSVMDCDVIDRRFMGRRKKSNG